MTTITRELLICIDAYKAAIPVLWPGAKVMVGVRGWEDPAPVWDITFRTGAKFEGTDHNDVFERAKLYAQGVKNLIGEYP